MSPDAAIGDEIIVHAYYRGAERCRLGSLRILTPRIGIRWSEYIFIEQQFKKEHETRTD